MTASNIGVVFGPSILKSPNASIQAEIADSASKCLLVEFLILHTEQVFGESQI
jgi:hypothetical protein